MTRRAKERRLERVQARQRSEEALARRHSRPEWTALLALIDSGEAVAPAATEAVAAASARDALAPVEQLRWTSTHVPVAAASAFTLPIQVDASRATVRYEFSTRDFDISFGVQLLGTEGNVTELLEPKRYESHQAAVVGSVDVSGRGMVLLVWDNTFSWLNAKQLAYTVELRQEVPPADWNPPTAASDDQRWTLAVYERAKREKLRLHRKTELQRLTASVQTHEQQIEFLRHQIETLQRQLEETETAKTKTLEQTQHTEDDLETLEWEIEALTWRAIGPAALATILSFGDGRDVAQWSMVSHTWRKASVAFRQSLSA
ncbi:hypothetical protein ATCC90586_009923 [Pythium insidiosum]|nr:hypothetical protein ATCC90586_009923 [Pythium insidiosum]